MSRTFSFLFVICSLCLSVLAQVAPEAQTLVPGQPVEREIAGGQLHTYQISLAAGQFVRVVVEQRGIDVALALAGPDGKPLIESDLTGLLGLAEPLSYEAAAAGTYQLVVRANGAATQSGAYETRLDVKASASVQDRKRLTAESLLNEARRLYTQGRYADPQLSEKLGQALGLCRELEDHYLQGLTLNLIGFTHLRSLQYDKAFEAYEQALSLWRGEKLRAGEATLLHYLGSAYLGRNNDKSIEYQEQALTIYREVNDRGGEARALNGLGAANTNESRYEKAIEYFEQALAIHREVKDRDSEAIALNNLGLVYGRLSRYERVIEYHEQALVLSREIKNRGSEASALVALGDTYRNLARFEKAIEYYEQALVLSREVKDRNSEANALQSLGIVNSRLSRHDKAIEYHELALGIAREMKDRWGEANALAFLGGVYSALSRYEKAIEYFEQMLVVCREMKSRGGEGSALLNLGVAHSDLGRYEKAIEYFELALGMARERKSRGGEAGALQHLSLVYERLGRYEKAIEYFEQAFAFQREAHNPVGDTHALHRLALLERKRGNLPAARTYIEESLKLAEATRVSLMSPESRASFSAKILNFYKVYTDVLMRQHQAEPTKGFDALAVETSERQRARSLLDLLTEARADVRQGVDAALLERERSLGKQLNDKAQLLTKANKPEQADALKKEIGQLETDYERVQAAIRKTSPHYAALTQPQPLKLKEIQQQLDADTLLLEYALSEERSYLWAITKDSLTSYELPKDELIEKNARQVYELLTARSTNKRGETAPQRRERISQAEAQLPAAAQELSQTILAPVAAQLGNKRLVIVADGALQYVPFAMLPAPATGGQGDRETGRENSIRPVAPSPRPSVAFTPLIVEHEIISLPSASTLAIQRKELAGRQLAPKMLAVIADPVFASTDARKKSAATQITAEPSLSTGTADTRIIEHLAEKSTGGATGRLVIPRLPFTRQEAEQILSVAPNPTNLKAIDFKANRATAMSAELSQYRYLHFATHGLLDSERPGLSALVLSLVDEQGKPQDGFLRANDIYNLNLPAELVVLSACQTGLGKDVKGEGLVGITRGFMYAGAARVVVSLWSVNDKATSELMTKFYQKMLKEGQPPAAALRAAQVEMWKQKQWQSPFYWAAFVMQGEWK